MSTRKEFRKSKKQNLVNKEMHAFLAKSDRPIWADDEKAEETQKFDLKKLLAEVAEANKLRDKKG